MEGQNEKFNCILGFSDTYKKEERIPTYLLDDEFEHERENKIRRPKIILNSKRNYLAGEEQ